MGVCKWYGPDFLQNLLMTNIWLRWGTLALLMSATCEALYSAPDVVTLKDARAEVTLANAPYPRVVAYAAEGKPSLLFCDPDGARSGLRFVGLEKRRDGSSEYAFDQAGEWLARAPQKATLRASSGAPGKALQLTAIFRLEDGVLRVSCSLKNTSAAPRELALWTIAALPARGWMVAPFSRGLENNRWVHGRLVSYWTSSLAEPCLQLGQDGFGLNLQKWSGTSTLKVGTRADAAWAAAARPDLEALLVARWPYAPGDSYPDEDCNATLWMGNSPRGEHYAEMEWLSPWKSLEPGEALRWSFDLQLRDLPPGGELSSDALVQLVRAPCRLTPAKGLVEDVWRIDARGPLQRDAFGKVTEWYRQDGICIARAPFWQDAPEWQAAGPALRWDESTIVEAESSAWPPWQLSGRFWTLEFSPSREGGRQMLLQDGTATAGLLLMGGRDQVEAFLWTSPREVARLAAPLSAGRRHIVKAAFHPEERRFELQVDGAAPQSCATGEVGAMPGTKLSLGRGEVLPPAWKMVPLAPFRGLLYRLEISSRKTAAHSR